MERAILPTTVYEVMAYRFDEPDRSPGAGPIITLPPGWAPLAAELQGEVAVVLCYREQP